MLVRNQVDMKPRGGAERHVLWVEGGSILVRKKIAAVEQYNTTILVSDTNIWHIFGD